MTAERIDPRAYEDQGTVPLTSFKRDGTPSAPMVRARARVLEREARATAWVIESKYPILHRFLIPRYHRLIDTRTVHVEDVPVDGRVRTAEGPRDVERGGATS